MRMERWGGAGSCAASCEKFGGTLDFMLCVKEAIEGF